MSSLSSNSPEELHEGSIPQTKSSLWTNSTPFPEQHINDSQVSYMKQLKQIQAQH